jgi:phospholipid transport system substrate-binding protein
MDDLRLFVLRGHWGEGPVTGHIERKSHGHSRVTALAAALAAVLSLASPAVSRADTDPAVQRIQTLDDGLFAAARAHDLRSAKVRQLLDQAFNLPIMAQFAVGPSWATLSATDRAGVLEALSRYTEARYAYEFRDFDTQTVVIDPVVQVRGLDRLVRAEIRATGEAPVKIGYRLREYGGAWRIIDVIYNGVSQLATQRADFAASLQKGGAAALIRSLDQSTAKLK